MNLLNTIKTTTISLIITTALLSPAMASTTSAGKLKGLSGQANVIRNGQTLPAANNMSILEKDKVTTKMDSLVGIVFKDGTKIILGENSEIQIHEYCFEPQNDLYQFESYLKKGRSVYESGIIGKLSPKSVKFSTPDSVVSVRGTKFIAEVN